MSGHGRGPGDPAAEVLDGGTGSARSSSRGRPTRAARAWNPHSARRGRERRHRSQGLGKPSRGQVAVIFRLGGVSILRELKEPPSGRKQASAHEGEAV